MTCPAYRGRRARAARRRRKAKNQTLDQLQAFGDMAKPLIAGRVAELEWDGPILAQWMEEQRAR